MRKQIAAANWKMNLTYRQGEELVNKILEKELPILEHQQVIFAVPYPYLIMAKSVVANEYGYDIAAQNCSHKQSGAYTGEVSGEMLQSIGIHYCILGHSERRQYFQESNHMIAEKLDQCLQFDITPIFCCGESLSTREKNDQNEFVEKQLDQSLYHLSENEIKKVVIAYEPIWAIGTGKTATTAQAQEMHQHIRSTLAGKWGQEVANEITILYGGSVKGNNAKDLFSNPDVDGGLVGGASLVADEFVEIIKALKH
ncbi:MAG: triose-phosphate isomerase [Candidatus Dadabacteria bacterium]